MELRTFAVCVCGCVTRTVAVTVPGERMSAPLAEGADRNGVSGLSNPPTTLTLRDLSLFRGNLNTIRRRASGEPATSRNLKERCNFFSKQTNLQCPCQSNQEMDINERTESNKSGVKNDHQIKLSQLVYLKAIKTNNVVGSAKSVVFFSFFYLNEGQYSCQGHGGHVLILVTHTNAFFLCAPARELLNCHATL